MRRLFPLLCLLLAAPALASDVLQGVIVSSGASVNNLTTASPFQLPQGGIILQCSADTYVYPAKDATAAVATSSNGIKIVADEKYATTTTSTRGVMAVLPVSGSASCKVFAIYNDTTARRFSPPGGGGGVGIDPSLGYTMATLTATGQTSGNAISITAAKGVRVGSTYLQGGPAVDCDFLHNGTLVMDSGGLATRLCVCVWSNPTDGGAWIRLTPGDDPNPVGTFDFCPT